jgi:creatinine amidohydrolase
LPGESGMQFILQVACAATVALAATHSVLAQTSQTIQLEDLTWTELRDQIHAGKTTIVVPIGGTEQSGRLRSR